MVTKMLLFGKDLMSMILPDNQVYGEIVEVFFQVVSNKVDLVIVGSYLQLLLLLKLLIESRKSFKMNIIQQVVSSWCTCL